MKIITRSMAKKALFCEECNTSNDKIVDKIFDQKEMTEKEHEKRQEAASMIHEYAKEYAQFIVSSLNYPDEIYKPPVNPVIEVMNIFKKES